MASSSPKALLLLGVLLAALVLPYTHVIAAAEEKPTKAIGDTVADDKQADAVCPGRRCCKWYRHGFGVRCVRCCPVGEEAPAQVDDDKQAETDAVCPRGRCCKWYRHGFGVRCVRCCADGEESPAQVPDGVDDSKRRLCRCCHFVKYRGKLSCARWCCPSGEEIPVEDLEAEEPQN